MPSLID
ncbi:uncharacterized protein FFFS_16013 [Fusarium fujikuroi]|nr:uncharacterized protein FFFS_16013 [Fusarium fujikuroi]